MLYQERTLEAALEKVSQEFKAVHISGMRQVGKGTLLKHLGKNSTRKFLSLDNAALLRTAVETPSLFLTLNPPPLALDEVQWAPELFPALKEYLDETEARGTIWLTGSQRLELWKAVTDKPPGRVASLELMPFSIYERNGAGRDQMPYLPSFRLSEALVPQSAADTWKTVWQGAWPDIVSASPEMRSLRFENLVAGYLRKDVFQLDSIRKILDFRKFLAVLASRTGETLVLQNVASETGLSLAVVRSWLEVAASGGLIFFLQPYFSNIGKRLVKTPRMHFTDTGLVCYLLDLQSPEELMRYGKKGSVWETFVISEILKSWVHNGKTPRFYFYRDSDQREVDLLIHANGRFHPVEIKASESLPSAKALAGISVFRKIEKNCGTAALISMCPDVMPADADCIAHPVWRI